MPHYKSIFISDMHLGSKACQADIICDFLKKNTCDNLFLVGDIIDGWRLSKKWYWPQTHTDVIRKILSASKKHTNVFYILGNHDEALRKFLTFDIHLGEIKILDSYDYTTTHGEKYLIIHGDQFDSLMLPNTKWLMHVGDAAYNFMIWVNVHLNGIRKLFGKKYWSLSKFLKSKTKSALNFIYSYEKHIANHCLLNNYDGVICGHIHTPVIKTIDGVKYFNTGDMCENCSVLVETQDGEFELIFWK